MSYGVKLRVWGDYASFNRPEMKVERVTYEVMTPSAARGILEAIHWKPGMRWVIDAIHVLRPIRLTHVRRNEISTKIPTKGALGLAMRGQQAALGIAVEEYRQQRAAIVLRDVAYGIVAHAVVLRPDVGTDGRPLEHPEAKHLEAFRRRASKGQCFHQPYLGSREFPAAFELVDSFPECPDELRGEHELGMILHDLDFVADPQGAIIESSAGQRVTATARFFPAVLKDGVLTVPPWPQRRTEA